MLTLHREVCTRSDSRKHTRTHARRHRAAGDPPDSPRSWLAPFLCCPFPSPTAPLPSCVISQVTHRLVSACLTTDTPKAPTARCLALLRAGGSRWEPRRPCLGPLFLKLGPSGSRGPQLSLSLTRENNKNSNSEQQLLPPGGVRVPSRTPFMICAPPQPYGLKPFVYGITKSISDPGLKPSPLRPACGPPRRRHTRARVGSGPCKPGHLWEKQEGGKSKMGWSGGGGRSQAEG